MDSSTSPSQNTLPTPLPNREITQEIGYEGRQGSVSKINPKYLEHLEGLLQIAHDKMDEDNVKTASGRHCRWCRGPWGYDADGIKHEDDCILVKIRQVL